ncbi:hypothetical protein SDC9_45662 [bioreactor metagenome]|uniref:DUF2231 domain-containing protein n=1 Tax=bioreactor metagenome TaxID=1076179 RepID=A0A644W6L4_9ZZZZ
MNTDTFHPMVVHFSVALVIVGFVIDFFYIFIARKDWRKTSSLFLMILAALAVFLSWYTGEYYGREYFGPGDELRELHDFYAKIVCYVFGFAFAVRIAAIYIKKDIPALKYVYIAAMLAAVGFIAYVGYLGGQLVYEMQQYLSV